MSQNEIIQKLKSSVPELKKKYPIQSVAVFGSMLRDDFDDEKSDVDLLVDYQGNDFLLFSRMADELESILGKKVDIVTLRSLKERHWNYLRSRIIYV